MKVQKIAVAFSATLVSALSVFAQPPPAVVLPTFTKGFFQGLSANPQLTVAADGTTTATLRFSITNNDLQQGLTNLTFTDTLPAGLRVAANPAIVGNCGGVQPIAIAGSNQISLTGGALGLGVNANCQFVVNVVGITAGTQINTTGTIGGTDGTAGNFIGGTATAAITVVAPATITKAFGNPAVAPGQSTTLTFRIANPNATIALTGVAVTDVLPAGLTISAAGGATTNCAFGLGGGVTAIAGTNAITVFNGTLAAGAFCTVTVNVTGVTAGTQLNTTSTVTSIEGGIGGVAAAAILVGDPFQVRYASNLAIGDSYINFTNDGSSATTSFPAENGNICVNAYAFSPDEQLISCCSCAVTPNGLDSLSARNDLISNTLTPAVPTSIVIKLVATTGIPGAAGATTCNAATVGLGANALTTGLAAWGTTLHALPAGADATPYTQTETSFTVATLSFAELNRIRTLCGFIQTNGSGFGVCKTCRLGGLGAERQ